VSTVAAFRLFAGMQIAVLGNLSRDPAQKLRQANQLIGVLAA